jgi:predicted DNA-binding transcriptional regulator AlpA
MAQIIPIAGRAPPPQPALIDLPEVKRRTSLSRYQIKQRLKRGAFPEPIKLNGRDPIWRDDEITAWIDELTAARDTGQGDKSGP